MPINASRSLTPLGLATLLLTACGSVVVEPGSSGGSTSSHGMETCPGVDGYIELSVAGAEPVLLKSVCRHSGWTYGRDETSMSLGFYTLGAKGINIAGCLTASTEKGVGVLASSHGTPAVGTFTEGGSNYIDEEGNHYGYQGAPTTFTVTKLEPTGGMIEGSFASAVTAGYPDMIPLSGTFRVCHVTDVQEE